VSFDVVRDVAAMAGCVVHEGGFVAPVDGLANDPA